MKQFANRDSSVVIVQRGEELHEKLREYAQTHDLESAWVSGLGGSGTLTLGFYDIETREYEWKEFNDPLEILSLQGNLAWVDDEPFWHIHGVFSGRDFAAVGGHVKELVVGLTCELHITPLETLLTRVFDDETGLKLLEEQQGEVS